MKINQKQASIIILSSLLFSTGCMNRKAIVKDTFLMDAQRAGSPAQAASEKILAVLPFSIAPAFEGNGVVSRVAENRYKSDFYNEYFVSPAQMIADQTRNWMFQSGLFAQVLSPISSVQPTHVLEGHIRKMLLDIRDSSKPRAVLEMKFFLIERNKRESTIRFQKLYKITEPMAEQTPQGYISAQNICLMRILKMLEKDIALSL